MCTFFGAHFCPNFCEHMSRFFARTPCELPAKPTPYKPLPQGLRIWSNLPESSTLVLFPQGFLLFASVWHENRFRGSENEAMGILSGDATTGGGGRSQLCCISPNQVFQIILRKLCHSIISPCEPRVICWCVTLALNRGGAWLLQSLNWLELLQGSEHFAPWGQSMQVTWGRRGMQSYCALHLPWTLACANVANALKDKIFWQNMKNPWGIRQDHHRWQADDCLFDTSLNLLWTVKICILKSGNRMDASSKAWHKFSELFCWGSKSLSDSQDYSSWTSHAVSSVWVATQCWYLKLLLYG